MAILDEADTTYRRAAVKALGVIGADAVPPLVKALLNSDNVTLRGSAAKAIAPFAHSIVQLWCNYFPASIA